VTASILLLDPYRSALAARGISEQILSPASEIDITKTPTWKVGHNRSLQATVMQFVTLFDDVMLVQNEKAGDAERVEKQSNSVRPLSLLPFTHMELVRFTASSNDPARDKAVKDAKYIEDIWAIEKNNLDAWEPFIIPMLLLKGVIPHASIYHFLRAVRLEDHGLIQQTMGKIPPEISYYAPAILDSECTP
jgi:hypothetical protein